MSLKTSDHYARLGIIKMLSYLNIEKKIQTHNSDLGQHIQMFTKRHEKGLAGSWHFWLYSKRNICRRNIEFWSASATYISAELPPGIHDSHRHEQLWRP